MNFWFWFARVELEIYVLRRNGGCGILVVGDVEMGSL